MVAEAPAPVCTTCAPTCVETYPVYNYGWRYGRDHYRFHREFPATKAEAAGEDASKQVKQ